MTPVLDPPSSINPWGNYKYQIRNVNFSFEFFNEKTNPQSGIFLNLLNPKIGEYSVLSYHRNHICCNGHSDQIHIWNDLIDCPSPLQGEGIDELEPNTTTT